MSETEDRVYALIDVAGQQQGSVQSALDGLAGAGGTIAAQAEAATKPVLAQLAGVVETGGIAEFVQKRKLIYQKHSI